MSCCPAQLPVTPAEVSSQTVDVTLLYTSDEHGWLEPGGSAVPMQGGLMQLYDQLVHDEGHCAGAWPAQVKPDCTMSNTLLLSGGDNYTGPALSSFFRGTTTAEALRRLGYAASAFGNHELDFGGQQYFANRDLAELTYLAANLVGTQAGVPPLTKPYVIIERAGVRIGVIGVATPETPRAAAPHRFEGLAFDNIEQTLTRVVPQVWAQQVDATVVLAHECLDKVEPVITHHPEWRLSFVGAGHCHQLVDKRVAGVPLIAPDWRARRYAKVRLRIDKSKPLMERASVLSQQVIAVKPRSHAAEVDVSFAERVKEWRAELEAALGQQIGFSASGMAKNSPELSRWILRSWRASTGAELAITTRGGIRQELKPGPITRESVLSVLPFENALVTCELPGSALKALLERPEVRVVGVNRNDDGQFILDDGKPLESARRYRVVTTDFLYSGGDGMPFSQYDPNPKPAFKSWREPVISWTLAQHSSEQKPLESLLSEGAAGRSPPAPPASAPPLPRPR